MGNFLRKTVINVAPGNLSEAALELENVNNWIHVSNIVCYHNRQFLNISREMFKLIYVPKIPFYTQAKDTRIAFPLIPHAVKHLSNTVIYDLKWRLFREIRDDGT